VSTDIGAKAGVLPPRLVVWLLIAICVLPLVAAWLAAGTGWRPQRMAVHGELLDPPLPLPQVPAYRVDGGALGSPETLAGRWLLVQARDRPCAAQCRRALAKLHRAALATGKHVVRLERVLLQPQAQPPPAELGAAPPGLLAPVPADQRGPHAALLDGAAAVLLLVDPGGRAVLRYPLSVPLPALFEDLQRLIGAGHGG